MVTRVIVTGKFRRVIFRYDCDGFFAVSKFRLVSAFFRNLGLEGSEGAIAFIFFIDVVDSKAQDELVAIYVMVEGAIPMFLIHFSRMDVLSSALISSCLN